MRRLRHNDYPRDKISESSDNGCKCSDDTNGYVHCVLKVYSALSVVL